MIYANTLVSAARLLSIICIGQMLIACSADVPSAAQPQQSSAIANSNDTSKTYPTGSYTFTCSDIEVQNDALSASCVNLEGRTQSSTMANLDICLNSTRDSGDIGNIDGNIICIPDIPKPDPTFTFPQAESALNQLIYSSNLSAIYDHAWGIWAGLTQTIGSVGGVPVRAFETWSTTGNMLYRMERGSAFELESQGTPLPRRELELSVPRQFKNIGSLDGHLDQAASARSAVSGDTNIFVSVAYNPPAAKHAITNKLFLQSTLDTYLANGYSEIPNFPTNAITIKPVYKVIPKNSPGGIYTFPGWPGTPSPAKTFGESDWDSCVYVNILSSGTGGSAIDPGCSGPSPATTFFLNNFVHQTVSAEDAQYLTSQFNVDVSEGDIAILVGMHVTSRETKRWTWQTFWWSASPDQPKLPSNADIAARRPTQFLDEATKHYAMSVAYQMLAKAQPIIGGESVGESVIGFNPHLEAGFDPGTFQIIRPINGSERNEYGVQTNCMTCHNLALYNPRTDYRIDQGANREKPYGTDYYMSIDDETFDGTLKLDFAWSILGTLKLDAP